MRIVQKEKGTEKFNHFYIFISLHRLSPHEEDKMERWKPNGQRGEASCAGLIDHGLANCHEWIEPGLQVKK